MVLLPQTDLAQADRMMSAMIGDTAFCDWGVMGADGPLKVTFSAGLTQVCSVDQVDQILARADHALYQAKEQGRNRLVTA